MCVAHKVFTVALHQWKHTRKKYIYIAEIGGALLKRSPRPLEEISSSSIAKKRQKHSLRATDISTEIHFFTLIENSPVYSRIQSKYVYSIFCLDYCLQMQCLFQSVCGWTFVLFNRLQTNEGRKYTLIPGQTHIHCAVTT